MYRHQNKEEFIKYWNNQRKNQDWEVALKRYAAYKKTLAMCMKHNMDRSYWIKAIEQLEAKYPQLKKELEQS